MMKNPQKAPPANPMTKILPKRMKWKSKIGMRMKIPSLSIPKKPAKLTETKKKPTHKAASNSPQDWVKQPSTCGLFSYIYFFFNLTERGDVH